jgi:CheY-like chemotaxis protein
MTDRYCPACGTTGPSASSRRDDRNVVECASCGLTLDTSRPTPWQPIGEVLVADDSDLLRVAVEDILLDKKLARAVTGAKNGQDLLELFTQRLRDGRPAELVMLDVKMPIMNGFNAAIALRAIERAFGVTGGVPILFFSAQACDATARKVVDFVGRAIYVNKDASPNLAALAQRLEQVLVNVLTKGAT